MLGRVVGLEKEGFPWAVGVVEELGGGRPRGLEIPSFIERCMMTCLDNIQCGVQVLDILVCRGIPKKDAGVVMAVELAALVTWYFYTHMGSKCLEVGHVQLFPVPSFIWCHQCGGVYKPVV